MEGYVIKSINHAGRLKVVNYQPKIDDVQMHKIKVRIIQNLQFIFSNGTKSIDT